MKKQIQKKAGISTGTVVGIGASLVALGAASYYFFGPEGKKHQDNFKGWMIKMKAEIIDKLEDAGDVTETVYHTIVDKVAAAYKKSKKVTPEEVAVYADLLKSQWKNIVGKTKKSGGKK